MLAGLKITAAVGGVSALIIAALWWQLGNAQDEADAQRERAGALRAQLDTASQAAQSNADKAAELAQQIERRDQILADHQAVIEQRRVEARRLMTALEEASRAAPVKYQDCIAMPLPRSVGELLRVSTGGGHPSDHSDRDPDRTSASQPDDALPGA